jgi:hypothetical protein
VGYADWLMWSPARIRLDLETIAAEIGYEDAAMLRG